MRALLAVLAMIALPALAAPEDELRNATLRDDGADGGIRDGEDDDIPAHGGVEVVLTELLDAVAALGRDCGDGLSHVAGAEDREVRHGVLLGVLWIVRIGCCYK